MSTLGEKMLDMVMTDNAKSEYALVKVNGVVLKMDTGT
jgi:hypothetical protein